MKNFNVLDERVFKQQLKYATEYNQKSKLGKRSFFVFGVVVVFVVVVSKIDNLPEVVDYFLMALLAASLLSGFLLTLKAKCPNCNKLQPGKTYTLSNVEIGYSQGISPFASRCAHCECYLSEKTLRRDLDKQRRGEVEVQ